MLLDCNENNPLLSDENKWRANEGVRKGSVVNLIALLPSCGVPEVDSSKSSSCSSLSLLWCAG